MKPCPCTESKTIQFQPEDCVVDVGPQKVLERDGKWIGVLQDSVWVRLRRFKISGSEIWELIQS
jgi:hypothetical protein